MSYSEDLEAIKRFIDTTPAVTMDASNIKANFLKWYDDLGIIERNFPSQETYDEARNRRNQFNLANAKTAAEKQVVQTVITTGLSTEQMRGEADRRDASGMYTGTTSGGLPVIKKGDRGSAVRWLQKFLHISVDGNFGRGTDAAVKKWQTDNGITADGIVGPQSWAAMGVRSPADLQHDPLPISPVVAPKPASGVATSFAVPTGGAMGPVAVPKAPAPAKPVQAGLLGNLDALPTPIKIVGGLLVAGAVVGAMADKKRK